MSSVNTDTGYMPLIDLAHVSRSSFIAMRSSLTTKKVYIEFSLRKLSSSLAWSLSEQITAVLASE